MFKTVLNIVRGSLDESMEWMKESWIRRCRVSLLQAITSNLTLPGTQFASWNKTETPISSHTPRVCLTLPLTLQQWLHIRGIAASDVLLFDSALFLHIGNAEKSTFRIRHNRTIAVFDRVSHDILVILTDVETRSNLRRPNLIAFPFPFLSNNSDSSFDQSIGTDDDAAFTGVTKDRTKSQNPDAHSSSSHNSNSSNNRGSPIQTKKSKYHLPDDNNLEHARIQSHALQQALINATIVRHIYQYEFARLTMTVAARQAQHYLSGDHPILPWIQELELHLKSRLVRGASWSGLRHVVFASGTRSPAELLTNRITQRDDVLLAVLARDPGTYLSPQRPLFQLSASSAVLAVTPTKSQTKSDAIQPTYFSGLGVPGFCTPALMQNPYYHDVLLGFRRKIHTRMQSHIDALGMSTRHNTELACWADVTLQKLRLRVPRIAQFAALPLLEELTHQCLAVVHSAEWTINFDDTLPQSEALTNVLMSWCDGVNTIRSTSTGPSVISATKTTSTSSIVSPQHFASPQHVSDLLDRTSTSQASSIPLIKHASVLWTTLTVAMHDHLIENKSLRVQGDEWVDFF